MKSTSGCAWRGTDPDREVAINLFHHRHVVYMITPFSIPCVCVFFLMNSLMKQLIKTNQKRKKKTTFSPLCGHLKLLERIRKHQNTIKARKSM